MAVLKDLEIRPGEIENVHFYEYLIVQGPDYLPHVSEDQHGYRPATLVLQHPGTGHNTDEMTIYIK